ncbi:hypothetical protein [Streptomyces sp. NBC_01361]|uniref:hypothetical protein n=1 Tax=Streptomyces sp. NBC_01361 TaxID=2903838 RepID=UPI002E2F555D|nr:hypothetical protein [Streptomyces sp. NBC_01361]
MSGAIVGRFQAIYPPFNWPLAARTGRRTRPTDVSAAPQTATPVPSYLAPRVAAVVAPYTDEGHAREFARLGWQQIAVLLGPGLLPAGAAPEVHGEFARTVLHDGGLRRTVRQLRMHQVRAVVAGSPMGVALAERLARELELPGNDPASTPARCDLGAQTKALAEHGITAPRMLHTTSLTEAQEWTRFCALPTYEVAPADTGVEVRARVCRTAQEIAEAWQSVSGALPRRGGRRPALVIREYLPGRRYVVHSLSGRGEDGTPEHTVTDAWAQSFTATGELDRMDLMSRHGLLPRVLSLYVLQVLGALEVSTGPLRCEIAYLPERGPVLLNARAFPEISAAGHCARTALGSDAFRDAAHAAIFDRSRRPVRSPGPLHLTRIRLLPTADGVLDRWLLRTITTLPTVTHADSTLMARAEVRSGVCPGEIVLRSSDEGAIEADFRVIRAVERLGLYEGARS